MKTKKKITLLTLTSAMIVGVGVGITIYSPQCASKIKESTSRTATTDDIEPITVEIPKIKKYTVEIENVELVKIKTYKFVSQIELKQINLPEVKKNDDRIPEMIKLQKIQMKLFKDQRNLMYDKTIGLDSKIWKEWIKIYKTAKPYNLKYIKMKSPLRIIAEVLVPKTYEEEETLKKNLKYYKSRGYDSALLSFDTSETLHSLTRTSEIIRNSGLNVWITFSGPEDLGHSVFVDPVKLESYLITLGSYAEGFILGWRRTSLHLLLQDWQFSDFLMKSVRMGNENIVILGESYIGETAETPEHTRITTYNNPKNISGTVISGLGFHGVNVKGALNGIFSPVKNMDRIALIVGSNPYYMTLEKAKYTKKEQDTIKAALEKRFINAGCIGTITLHGDGGTVFVNGEKRITDNLCLNFGE